MPIIADQKYIIADQKYSVDIEYYESNVNNIDISNIQENTLLRLCLFNQTFIFYPQSPDRYVTQESPNDIKYITGGNQIYIDSDYLVKFNINIISNIGSYRYKGDKTIWSEYTNIPTQLINEYFTVKSFPEYLRVPTIATENNVNAYTVLIPKTDSNPIIDMFPKRTITNTITPSTPEYSIGIPNTKTGLIAIPIIGGQNFETIVGDDIKTSEPFIKTYSNGSYLKYYFIRLGENGMDSNSFKTCFYYPSFNKPTYILNEHWDRYDGITSHILRIIPEVVPKNAIIEE